MSNTLRRIYKQSCEQGYPSAPEHQSSLSEKSTPDSPIKSDLYAELKDSQEARSVVLGGASKNTMIPSTGNVSPKVTSQKKIRHRRLGSTDSNYSFTYTPKQMDRRNVKMVHMETQTDILDNDDINQSRLDLTILTMPEFSSVTSPEYKDDSPHEREQEDEEDEEEEEDVRYKIRLAADSSGEICKNNRNVISTTNTPNGIDRDETDRIYDYMNSNEQLDVADIRESSDEDNLEKLNRRVNQFFNQNRLLQSTENGNGSIIENRLLFNIMAARRSCISINDKEVTVLSRGNGLTANSAHFQNDLTRRDPSSYKISDHNCNNDDGDDSWTDEEGEESDQHYSLRRKRLVFDSYI